MSRILTDACGLGGRGSIFLNGSQKQLRDQLGLPHVIISVQKRGDDFPEKKKRQRETQCHEEFPAVFKILVYKQQNLSLRLQAMKSNGGAGRTHTLCTGHSYYRGDITNTVN